MATAKVKEDVKNPRLLPGIEKATCIIKGGKKERINKTKKCFRSILPLFSASKGY